MLKERRILLTLAASLIWGAGVARAKEDHRPDTTLKSVVPVPMTTVEVNRLTKLTNDNHDTLWVLEKVHRPYGEVVVRFKTLDVEGDDEAGVLFRYTDSKNYYAVVANVKDDMCTFYRVEDGSWKKEGYQETIISPMTWHELRVVFTQESVTALLDGELTLGVKVSNIKNPGRVGLWAKVGSKISFEKFQISRP